MIGVWGYDTLRTSESEVRDWLLEALNRDFSEPRAEQSQALAPYCCNPSSLLLEEWPLNTLALHGS